MTVEAAVSSDHTPLVLSLKKVPWRKKRKKGSKYESGWALEEGYQEIITSVWEQEGLQYEGWDQVATKLGTCMQRLV